VAKVYLMIEDWTHNGKEGLDFGVDWGLGEGEELPEDVHDLTLAQYTAHKFCAVLRGMADKDAKAAAQQEVKEGVSGILVPDKMA